MDNEYVLIFRQDRVSTTALVVDGCIDWELRKIECDAEVYAAIVENEDGNEEVVAVATDFADIQLAMEYIDQDREVIGEPLTIRDLARHLDLGNEYALALKRGVDGEESAIAYLNGEVE